MSSFHFQPSLSFSGFFLLINGVAYKQTEGGFRCRLSRGSGRFQKGVGRIAGAGVVNPGSDTTVKLRSVTGL